MTNIKKMERQELISLKSQVEARLKRMRPIRVKKAYKRCGKSGCACSDGPADGSWGNLHGPYLFARFTERTTKKSKSLSLGRFYNEEALRQARNSRINWQDYFCLGTTERGRMSFEMGMKFPEPYYLDNDEFLEMHGVDMADDRLDRDGVYYASEAQKSAFEAKKRSISQEVLAADADWAVMFGMGSPIGQRVLAALLLDDYYLA